MDFDDMVRDSERTMMVNVEELKEQLNSVQEENAKLKIHESAACEDDFPSKEAIWETMRLVIEYVSDRLVIADVSDN